MSAVSGLCDRVVVLDNGALVFDGQTRPGIDRYMGNLSRSPGADLRNVQRAGPGHFARFKSIGLFNEAGQPCDTISMGDSVHVDLELVCTQRLGSPEIGLPLQNSGGTGLHYFISHW